MPINPSLQWLYVFFLLSTGFDTIVKINLSCDLLQKEEKLM